VFPLKDTPLKKISQHALFYRRYGIILLYSQLFDKFPKLYEGWALVCPSDKKYAEVFEKRQQATKKRGQYVNSLFFKGKNITYKLSYYSSHCKMQ